jgi:hypothetical protein
MHRYSISDFEILDGRVIGGRGAHAGIAALHGAQPEAIVDAIAADVNQQAIAGGRLAAKCESVDPTPRIARAERRGTL